LIRFWKDNTWLYLIVGAVLGFAAYPLFNIAQTDFAGFLESLAPEALGITFTILIIDRLDSVRENRLIREQLVRKMQSRDNKTALQAVEELRVLKYLMDGTLQGEDMRGAALENANLYQADLRRADLTNANLRNADLYGANLEEATVTTEQLALTSTMRWATMPDGSRYDGRFNLYHDFEVMPRKGFDASDAQQVANYYDVPLEIYLAGQTWAGEHLAALQKDAPRSASG
jgi:hypothetical protein